MEQLVARWAHNPKVVGSSPAPATKKAGKSCSGFFVADMFHVYVLYSQKFDKIYIGMTSDIDKRIFAHNNLPKGWTSHFRPWMLVYFESFDSAKQALAREKQLKSSRGREYIRNFILKP